MPPPPLNILVGPRRPGNSEDVLRKKLNRGERYLQYSDNEIWLIINDRNEKIAGNYYQRIIIQRIYWRID